MPIINSLPGRSVWWAALALLVLTAVSGCANEPVGDDLPNTVEPLPTLVTASSQPVATPTLASDAPTRGLPTPPVTRTNADQARTSAIPVTPSPAGPSPTPSATPAVAERLALGAQALQVGDYGMAAEQYSKVLRQEPALDAEEQAATLLKLGRAYLADEHFMDAATIFNQLVALAADEAPPETYFLLGQAYAGQEALEDAIEAYGTFLDAEPELGAYVYPLIAEASKVLGDLDAVIAAYEAALEAPSFRLHEVETRLQLANAYLAAGDPQAAVAEYDAVHDLAETVQTRGQMIYLAGAAELAAGNTTAAYERFLKGITDYPQSYDSYLGLVELVKAGEPVDDYQRGLVDYYAAAYAPGIEAFRAHIDANPEDYEPQTRLFLALSHEALGDFETAVVEIKRYTEIEPAAGLLEQAKMYERAAEAETAAELYAQYLETYPDGENAASAIWSLATLTAALGDTEGAIALFDGFVTTFPEHEDAPQALYRAGELALAGEDAEAVREFWMRAAETYPAQLYGSEALLALLRAELAGGGDLDPQLVSLAAMPANVTYQALRARDLAEGRAPFDPRPLFSAPVDEHADLVTAETWLVDQFGLDPAQVSGALPETLQEDARLVVGRRLWELGLLEEARRELEDLRQAYAEDPLATYQLALFFRDLGLYRSSISAASTLLRLAGQHELQAPALIGRLSYPIYYADLILPLAERYGYDPRLQFSLVRQESLFESFARSGAAAQGLSQVIPDTGAWIAERLQWPEYENDHLYRPHVGLNFGAYYLAEQLDYFDGDIHAALAAYNAGPGNAARWHDVAGDDPDLFVDTIDFWETKAYVERIYAGFDIYRQLYGGE